MARARDQKRWRDNTTRRRIEVYLPPDTVAALDAMPGSRAQAIAALVETASNAEPSTTGSRPPIESTTHLIADTPPGGRCFAWGETDTIRVDRNPARFKLNGRRLARAKLEAMILAEKQPVYR